MSREVERLRKRLNRLKRLQERHEHVSAHRRQVYSAGRKPREIFVRAGFVHSGVTGTRPPIVRLITPHGVTLQTFLVALFEAQCQHRSGTAPLNDRPLRAQEPGEVGWLDLIASVANADPVNSVEHATVQDNRLRQIKSALRVLSSVGLVSVTGEHRRNGRFEGFRLGHESGVGESVAYTVPRPERFEVIRLPIDFFLRGWVHVLSPAEIATYLMLCHLAVRFPEQHKENGVFVAGSTRETRYGLRRDVYEAHQLLTHFRLVERLPDPKRRPSGHIRDYHQVQKRGETVSPHRFQLLEDCFRRDALRVARARLERNLPDRPPMRKPVAGDSRATEPSAGR